MLSIHWGKQFYFSDDVGKIKWRIMNKKVKDGILVKSPEVLEIPEFPGKLL